MKSTLALHDLVVMKKVYGKYTLYFPYVDNSPQLRSLASNELMLQEASTPHRPHFNSVIGIFVKLVIVVACRLLYQSSLLLKYWTLVALAFCHGRNV